MIDDAHLVRRSVVDEFLAGHRIAVIGASDDPKSFARTVFVELASHGYEPVAVHPTATTVAGTDAYPDLAAVPGDLDGAVVMVNAEHAEQVVHDCLDQSIDRIWLFRGVGGDGAASDAAIAACVDGGAAVVPGACPLMFLEPVGWGHRVHRSIRRRRGAVVDDGAEPVTTAGGAS